MTTLLWEHECGITHALLCVSEFTFFEITG